WRSELPGLVIDILVENERAARLQRIDKLLERLFRARQEGENPTRPSRVGAVNRNRVGHDIDFVRRHLSEAARLRLRLKRIEKAPRALERMHMPKRTNDLGQVHCRKAGACAEVDHFAAIANARTRPGIQRARAPDTMLEP